MIELIKNVLGILASISVLIVNDHKIVKHLRHKERG